MNVNFSKSELMDLTYDPTDHKLARGLVREELRPYQSLLDRHVQVNLMKYISELRDRHMSPNTHKFSTPAAEKLRKLVYRRAANELKPIEPFKEKVLLDLDDRKPSEIQGFFYWQPTRNAVTESGDNHSWVGTFLELRAMRVGCNRRRLVLDDTFCHVMVSDHFLARLLERGYTVKQPLATLNRAISQFFPRAVAMAFAYKAAQHSTYPHVLIPLGDGVILAKLSLTLKVGNGRHIRFRAIANSEKTSTSDWPLETLLDENMEGSEGYVTVYAATYIDHDRLSTEQYWAKLQLEKLFEDEDDIDYYGRLIYLPELVSQDSPEKLRSLVDRVGRIIKNPRWKIATSAALMQSS